MMKKLILILGTILLLSHTLNAPIEYDVDVKTQVVILVNEKLPESVTIGKYYAKKRGIPESQICQVKTTGEEIISWDKFREEILTPLEDFLKDKPDVLYIVPIYGIPLKTKEENPDNDVKKGETAFEKAVLNRDYCCIDREIELLNIPHLLDGWVKNDLFAKEEKITTKHNIYIVSRLDGLDQACVMNMIDNAIYGETYGVEGEFYLDTRGLTAGGYAPTDMDMKKISDVFKKYGFTINHEDTEKVQDLSELKDIAHYWGWYAGNIVAKNDFKFMPGAVGAHLHSFAANTLRSTNKNWTGPLIYHGIAGTCGTVYEPLSIGFPNGTIFFDRFLAGYTFGESMQISNMFTSWMAVFVGDPLYAPYAKGRKEIQDKNRNLVKKSPQQISDFLNEGEIQKAFELAEKIKQIGIWYKGLNKEDNFIIKEALARYLSGKKEKTTVSVAEMFKLYEEGEILFEQGKYAESIEKAKRVLSLNPYNYENNLLIIKSSLKSGDISRIDGYVEKAQKVWDEGDYWLNFALGLIYKRQKKYTEALHEFETALQYRSDPECYVNIATILIEQKKHEEALAMLQKVYESKKDYATMLGLSRAYNGINDYAKSLNILNDSLKQVPSNDKELMGYKELFIQLLTTAKLAEDKEKQKMASSILNDFNRKKAYVSTTTLKNNVEKNINEIKEENIFSPLFNLLNYNDKFYGFPQLFLANKSDYNIDIYLSGPTAIQIKLRPHIGKGRERVSNIYLFPGIYEVAINAYKQPVKKLFYGECRIEINQNYSLSFDDKLQNYLPKH